MPRKEYQIGEKKFCQEELVLSQIQHLTVRIKSVEAFTPNVMGVAEFVTRRTDLLACAIWPAEMSRDQWIEELDAGQTADMEKFIRNNCTIDTIMAIVTDFFAHTPISSLLNAIGALQEKMEQVNKVMPKLSPLLQPSKSSGKATTPTSPAGKSETASMSVSG